MNKTVFLNAVKIDDKSFLIDVLYFSATSYSSSYSVNIKLVSPDNDVVSWYNNMGTYRDWETDRKSVV